MRKLPLQDVIVRSEGSQRRSAPVYDDGVDRNVRQTVDVQRPPRRHPQERVADSSTYHEKHAVDDWEQPGDHSSGKKFWLIVSLAVSVFMVVIAVGLSIFFSGATVTVYPKQDTIVVNTSFLTSTDGSEGTLPFKRVVYEERETTDVEARSEQNVEERAFGTITVYNAYSESPQRLIKNTRFQSEQGNIYRIRESIEIPGKKGENEPGSIDVQVFAEEPGEQYNIPAGSFTVPGFANMPQEGKVYAQSKEAIAGGFAGVRRTVDDSDRQKALGELERQLRERLISVAADSDKRTEDHLFFKDAVFFEFAQLPDETSGDTHLTISLSGKIYVVLFEKNAFARRIASLTIGAYEQTPIRINNPYDLSVVVTPGALPERDDANSSEKLRPAWESDVYQVKVEGKTHFIWEYDPEQFAQDLSGKSVSILDASGDRTFLSAYPGISRVEARVRPFWRDSFPIQVDEIVVVTNLDS